ncbi:hypothetical protein O7606_22040 [Micromonospora sp. WMMD882]|uniref:hypothetical protein n=1 Tax=Micromonospora sp. WMMD882 TaxID=3015151 RepID=UPI00248BBCC0|nr:hypothetical protein [Micromonospora sp. WMMD882]WBB78855.1 hypothetical protein O7606_22040 [Micromonospora sp. WMMD882]
MSLAVLLLSGAVTVFVLYDRASAPDRTSPDVVVVKYLQNFLVDRNDARADLLTCDGVEGLAAIEQFRKDLIDRERALNVSVSINIEGLLVLEATESTAVVTAVIRRSALIDGVQQSLTDRWRFDLQELDGWRICTAIKS